MRRVVIMLVAAAALSGCGGTQNDVMSAPTPVASGCPATTSPATATAFPTNLPLPPGLVVTGYEQRSGGRQILTGVASGGFHPTLEFMQTRVRWRRGTRSPTSTATGSPAAGRFGNCRTVAGQHW